MVKNYNEVLYKNERIETERLILRKAQEGDAADLLEYASDPEVVETLMWGGLTTIEEARSSIFDYYWASPGKWLIEHKATGKMIGGIDLQLKHSHDKVTFGYVLNKRFWGKGYMSEAFKAVLDLCFGQLEVNRAEARHYTNNPASGRVMEKAGMVREGMALQGERVKGEFRDVIFYGITKEMWRRNMDEAL